MVLSSPGWGDFFGTNTGEKEMVMTFFLKNSICTSACQVLVFVSWFGGAVSQKGPDIVVPAG